MLSSINCIIVCVVYTRRDVEMFYIYIYRTSEDNHAANDFASLKVKVNIVTDLELLGYVCGLVAIFYC